MNVQLSFSNFLALDTAWSALTPDSSFTLAQCEAWDVATESTVEALEDAIETAQQAFDAAMVDNAAMVESSFYSPLSGLNLNFSTREHAEAAAFYLGGYAVSRRNCLRFVSGSISDTNTLTLGTLNAAGDYLLSSK